MRAFLRRYVRGTTTYSWTWDRRDVSAAGAVGWLLAEGTETAAAEGREEKHAYRMSVVRKARRPLAPGTDPRLLPAPGIDPRFVKASTWLRDRARLTGDDRQVNRLHSDKRGDRVGLARFDDVLCAVLARSRATRSPTSTDGGRCAMRRSSPVRSTTTSTGGSSASWHQAGDRAPPNRTRLRAWPPTAGSSNALSPGYQTSRLLVSYERRADIHHALLALGAADLLPPTQELNLT